MKNIKSEKNRTDAIVKSKELFEKKGGAVGGASGTTGEERSGNGIVSFVKKIPKVLKGKRSKTKNPCNFFYSDEKMNYEKRNISHEIKVFTKF